jgi:Family of unknown function (DUF5681)
MARGRPFQAGNTFGRGRPRGSRNKTTALAQQLLESHAEPVVRKALMMAIQGDTTAMRLCMDRILPVRRDLPVKLGDLPTATAAEVSRATQKVVQRVATGKLPIAQGLAVSEMLEKRRRAVETESLDERVRTLEGQ